MNIMRIFLFLMISMDSMAITFQQAIKKINEHDEVQILDFKSRSVNEDGKIYGSWGDPKFKLSAKNFPKTSFKDDETPMTGIDYGITQKIALSNKYGKIKKAYSELSQSYLSDKEERRQYLLKSFWEILILHRKVKDEILILNENKVWIKKILKVSKRLYSTGRVSQQEILDIQIRQSEIETNLNNKQYILSQIKDHLLYFIGTTKFDYSSIPWSILRNQKKESDYREISLDHKINAQNLKLEASRLNFIPDLNFNLSYTKRSNIDDRGDFLSASISFDLPFSVKKFGENEKAIQDKYIALKEKVKYKREKFRSVSIYSKEIARIIEELKILTNKTIKFAKNSREITAKSYALGNSSYSELLQKELKLQEILMQKILLKAQRDSKQVALKYTRGESLDG